MRNGYFADHGARWRGEVAGVCSGGETTTVLPARLVAYNRAGGRFRPLFFSPFSLEEHRVFRMDRCRDMNTQADIEAGLERLKKELGADPDIDAVYLFGSYAKGKPNRMSDIDIGLLLNDAVPTDTYFERRLEYMAQCAHVLRTDRVDVILLNNAPTHLAYSVISCRKVLFERSAQHRVAFEVDRINKYLDFKPFMQVRVKYMKTQILSGTFFD